MVSTVVFAALLGAVSPNNVSVAAAPVVVAQQTAQPPQGQQPDTAASTPPASSAGSDEIAVLPPKTGDKSLASAYPPGATFGLTPQPGGFYVSRWAEDWSYLKDPAKSDDLFDPLKFIPLTADQSVYLTLSGDARFGFYSYSHPALSAKGSSVDAQLLRATVAADLTVGPNLRFYVQLASADVGGSGYNSILAYSRSTLFVQQAFVEIKGDLAGAKVGTMIGRQEFTDGPIQLVSTRDVPNLHYEFNGARVYANWTNFRLDVFDLYSTQFEPGVFDTYPLWGQRLSGVNASFVLPHVFGTKLFFDPFLFNYYNNAKTWGTVTGTDDIDAYGGRLWGEIGRANVDWVFERQTGTFTNRNVDAFAVYTNQSYLLDDDAYQPRIGFHADVASGGGAYGKGTIHDVDYLFGQATYFSDGLLVVGQNIIDVSPNISFRPIKPMTLSFESEFLWRYADDDSIYPSSKVPYANLQNVRGSYVGDLLRFKGNWTFNRHISVGVALEYLDQSAAMTAAHLDNTFFTGSYLTLRF